MMPDTAPRSPAFDELATALDELGHVAGTHPGVLPAPRMRDLLERVLVDLGDLLATRFDREEAPGYLGGSALADVALARSAEALREQHRRLLARVHDLRNAALRADVAALRRDVGALVEAIQLHEHGELGLLQPAAVSGTVARD